MCGLYTGMKQAKPVFVCQECGAQQPKWQGRCPDCGAWNSFVEERAVDPGAGGPTTHRYSMPGIETPGAKKYAEIEASKADRITTGIGEFDRVLGGGIVPGSLVLLGGEPGIGKSTLLLQAAANFANSVGPVLYASGEESEHQIKSRGNRLGVGDAPLYLLSETCIERILEEVGRVKPALMIIDSMQTVFSLKFQSAPGSIGQVREAATQLLFTAKGHNIPTLLVGHVTKDGNLAGPKALEHVVDTVLYLRGRAASLPPRGARGEEPVRRGERAWRVRDDGHRFAPGAQSVGAVSCRASYGDARLRRAVLPRGLASAAGRSAGARQHEQLRPGAAHGGRHRSESPVAAARGYRETGRPAAWCRTTCS